MFAHARCNLNVELNLVIFGNSAVVDYVISVARSCDRDLDTLFSIVALSEQVEVVFLSRCQIIDGRLVWSGILTWKIHIKTDEKCSRKFFDHRILTTE